MRRSKRFGIFGEDKVQVQTPVVEKRFHVYPPGLFLGSAGFGYDCNPEIFLNLRIVKPFINKRVKMEG